MGQHWYDDSGNPKHSVEGKNGKIRDTTLADARKLGLFPSVTTIMNVQEKPQLTSWLQDELISAAIKEPYNDVDWNEEAWSVYIKQQMRVKGSKAADRGTEIHNKLEEYFRTGHLCPNDTMYLTPTIKLLESQFSNYTDWIAESTFAREGVGGSVDLHHKEIAEELPAIVVDFKTKDKEDISKVKPYGDNKMQLAAYQWGLYLPKNTRRFNIFINVNSELPKNRLGECNLVECNDYSRYLQMFQHLKNFWQLKNNYYPTQKTKDN